MINVQLVIPWRDRGTDPLRADNLERVLQHWEVFGCPVMVASDGGSGQAQFNRSAAYNRAAQCSNADVFIFTESDILLPYEQACWALQLALDAPGLVVPFAQYRYLTASASTRVRLGHTDAHLAEAGHVIEDGLSIGAVNVVSRETYDLVGGYDEYFQGAWYDDNAAQRAFELCCGPTRWVPGPAYHLYHLPAAAFRGADTRHLTDDDRAATARNAARYDQYLRASTPQEVKALTTARLSHAS